MTDFGIPLIRGRPVNVDPGKYCGYRPMLPMSITPPSGVKAFTAICWSHHQRGRAEAAQCVSAITITTHELAAIPRSVASTRRNRPSASTTAPCVVQDDGFFNQTELTQTLATGAIAINCCTASKSGASTRIRVTYSATNVATVSLFDPVLPQLQRISGHADHRQPRRADGRKRLRAPDLLTLSSQWKALVGVRYDVFEQETHERRAGQAESGTYRPRSGARVPAWCSSRPRSSRGHLSYSKSFQPSGESLRRPAATPIWRRNRPEGWRRQQR